MTAAARPHQAIHRTPAHAWRPVKDTDPLRWRFLALLATAELLAMSLWFVGNAVAPLLQEQWALTASQVGWMTTAVQLGFVIGTAAVALLNLADIMPGRTLFAASALLGAMANLTLLWADGIGMGVLSRLLTGISLAGVYPPAMKMASTWFSAARGLAVGTVVGALTIGKAGPYLMSAFAGTHSADVLPVVLGSTACGLAAAALVWLGYRDGPNAFPQRAFSWALLGSVVRGRRYRHAVGGYCGHMAELYGFWTWIPAFISASMLASAGDATPPASTTAAALAAAIIAVGGIGCVWGGVMGDRIGRAQLASLALAASGACALLIGFAFGRSLWLLAPIALVWGFFVIADSAQFSVMVTESVPPHAVGTALALQTSVGFLVTIVAIQVVPLVVGVVGWQWAFTVLVLGPAFGIWSVRRARTAPYLAR